MDRKTNGEVYILASTGRVSLIRRIRFFHQGGSQGIRSFSLLFAKEFPKGRISVLAHHLKIHLYKLYNKKMVVRRRQCYLFNLGPRSRKKSFLGVVGIHCNKVLLLPPFFDRGRRITVIHPSPPISLCLAKHYRWQNTPLT